MVNDIMKQMLELSIKNRLDSPTTSKDLTSIMYACQYKTIGATLPRRCGKSKWIFDFANSRSDKILIICKNTNETRFYNEFRNTTNVDVISITEDFSRRFIGRENPKYQYIIFDEYHFMPYLHVEQIYYLTANSDNSLQTYIRLGT